MSGIFYLPPGLRCKRSGWCGAFDHPTLPILHHRRYHPIFPWRYHPQCEPGVPNYGHDVTFITGFLTPSWLATQAVGLELTVKNYNSGLFESHTTSCLDKQDGWMKERHPFFYGKTYRVERFLEMIYVEIPD